jgi:signal transduction histidine kinase
MVVRVRRRSPPALRRIRRLKLLTALLLLFTASLAVVLFGLVVAAADARYERDRVDRMLRLQVAAALEQVRSADGGEPAVGPADVGELVGGYPQIYVVELAGGPGGEARVVLEPTTPFWPEAAVVPAAEAAAAELAAVDGLGGDARAEPDVVDGYADRIAPFDERQRLRLLAQPVRDQDGEVHAMVVGVATTTSGDASHARLVRFMWWSAGAVLLVGLFVAVTLARGRFWLIDKALQRHERFLHDTAHELRSPIGTLRIITQAGLAGDVAPREALDRAAQVIDSTEQVIDDLMTLTRIETGRQPLQIERLRLDLLVEALVSQRSDEPAVQLALRPTVVEANAELVRRAVGNLVENAVRHGRAGDPAAEVVVSVADGRVMVADRGAGVAPQIVTHLLERTDGVRRTGLGLGLAIVGWVARVHGGRVEASNRPDGGALFALELGGHGGARRRGGYGRRSRDRRRSGRAGVPGPPRPRGPGA